MRETAARQDPGGIPAVRKPVRPRSARSDGTGGAAPPRASRTLTLLTSAAALSLGWMILNDHVSPRLRSAPAEAHVQAPPEPDAAPVAAANVPSSGRTPLLTGDAARRALAAEARVDVRRRFAQPGFPPGEEPAL